MHLGNDERVFVEFAASRWDGVRIYPSSGYCSRLYFIFDLLILTITLTIRRSIYILFALFLALLGRIRLAGELFVGSWLVS